MNINTQEIPFLIGLVSVAFSAVTLGMVLRRGYGWVIPVRMALVGVAYMTAGVWSAKLLALAPAGVLNLRDQTLISVVAIFIVGGIIAPTYRQLRMFFFGERDTY